MTDDLVTIRKYWNLDEARRAKSTLDSACLMSFFENVCFAMMTPHIADPAGIALKVKSSDAQKAMELLAPQVFADYLPIAVLTGTDSESLVLQLWREPATEYTNFCGRVVVATDTSCHGTGDLDVYLFIKRRG